MTKSITIFSIISNSASIAGLYFAITDKNQFSYYYVFYIILFVLTFGLSFYVLFIPNNKVIQNVRNKIRKYSPIVGEDDLVDQRGEFVIKEMGPVTIEFDIPFTEPPKVEIINTNSYTEDIPSVDEITRYKVSFKRNSYTHGSGNKIYNFIAHGKIVRYEWL